MVTLVYLSLSYHICRLVYIHVILYRYKVEPWNDHAVLLEANEDHTTQGQKDTAFPQSDQHPSIRDMQIVSTPPALPKAPTAPLFSVVPAKFLVLWLEERILLSGDVESNPGSTSVCAARPHAGAGAIVHMFWTTPHHQQNIKNGGIWNMIYCLRYRWLLSIPDKS